MKDKQKIKIAPSILSADFGRLGQQIEEASSAGADYIHIDVMDGHFVPNITVGSPVVECIKRYTKLPLDVHLMVANPEAQAPLFAKAGANIISIHPEVCAHLRRAVETIKKLGCLAGVALNPGTPITSLQEVAELVDMVLIMSVDPGYSGQPFIPGTTAKVARLKKMLQQMNLSPEIEVDGGVNADNASKLVAAGTTVLVAGSAIFSAREGIASAISRIREATRLNSA